jgi:hypothetical protein
MCPRCVWPIFSPLVLSQNRPAQPQCLATRLAAQDEKMPLHHAAAKGAPLEVMKLLLDSYPEAVTVGDKVCR